MYKLHVDCTKFLFDLPIKSYGCCMPTCTIISGCRRKGSSHASSCVGLAACRLKPLQTLVPWWRVQLSVQHPDLHQHPDQHQHPDPSLTSKRTRMLPNRMMKTFSFMKAPALAGRLGGQNRTRRTVSSSAFGCRSARSATLPCWTVTSPSWGCAAVARGRHSTQVR